MVWLAMGGALGVLGFSFVLPVRFGDSGPVWLALSWCVFAVRTLVWHAGVFVALVGAIAALRRMWVCAGVGAVAAALVLWAVARPGSVGPADLVVVSANLSVGRADAAAVAEWARACGADVVLLQEYTPAFAKRFEEVVGDEWLHRTAWIRSDAFGQAVFSRLPLRDVEAFPHLAPGDVAPALGGGYVAPGREGGLVGLADPQIRFVVDVGGAAVTVQNLHTMPPIGLSMLGEQRELVRWLIGSVPNGAFVVGGDFNATPGSAHLDALRDAGLAGAHGSVGAGRGVTWPSGARPPMWMGVRIDHVLSGGGAAPVWSRVGPEVGSDHRPIGVGLRVE